MSYPELMGGGGGVPAACPHGTCTKHIHEASHMKPSRALCGGKVMTWSTVDKKLYCLSTLMAALIYLNDDGTVVFLVMSRGQQRL